MDGGLVSMTDPAPSPEIRAEAAAWLARLHAEDRDAADEAAFRAWLAASPEHADAFEAVDRMWSDVGGLTDLRADLRRVAPMCQPRSSRQPPRASGGCGASGRHRRQRPVLALGQRQGLSRPMWASKSMCRWMTAASFSWTPRPAFPCPSARPSAPWTCSMAGPISASCPILRGPSSSRRPSARSWPPAAISMCAARTARSRWC